MPKFTQEEYEDKLPKKRTYEIVGTYEGAGKKIEARCLVCGHSWFPRASALSEGQGCPACVKANHVKRAIKRFDYLARLRKDHPVTCEDCKYANVCTITKASICSLFSKESW